MVNTSSRLRLVGMSDTCFFKASRYQDNLTVID